MFKFLSKNLHRRIKPPRCKYIPLNIFLPKVPENTTFSGTQKPMEIILYSHSANRNKNQSIRGLQVPQNAVFPGVIPHVSDTQIHSGIKLVSIRYWHFRWQTVYYSPLNNDTCPTHPKYVALEWFTILQANGGFRFAVSAKPVIRKLK